MTREQELKILSLSPILYEYLDVNNKLGNGVLKSAKLSLSDIPTSTKQNQYTEQCRKEAGQSCIEGINLGNGLINNDNHKDFDEYKKFIIKDNVNKISSETIKIHKLYNHEDYTFRNIQKINLQNEIVEVPIGVGAQGIGRLRDDKEFTIFRQNMFEGDILWYYFIPELKEIYFLLERGFDNKIITSDHPFMKEWIEKLIKAYPTAINEEFSKHSLGEYLRKIVPNELSNFIEDNRFITNGSIGQGQWAEIPWIAVLIKNITESTQRGIYIIYLLNKNTNTLYLTFNQGVDGFTGTKTKEEIINYFHDKRDEIISKIDSKGFNIKDENIDLGTSLRAQYYVNSTIFSAAYQLNYLPSESILQSDLLKMIEIYNEYENIFYKKSFPSFTPSQIIYYGVPGTGKSYKIDNEKTIGFSDEQKMRVVFHPEYSNADFVGQILPTLKDDKVDYKFKPGPFTEILRRAYLNPSTPYALIIEEINRGNAAAILGDIFQLLDRIKKDDKTVIESENTYTEGWSSYSINNEFINWYFREGFFNEGYERETNPNVQIENEELKSIRINNGIKISANTGIRLPPNLSIYATMNTSDQNVFTLDNAFQRRWDMELVNNEFEKEEDIRQNSALTDEKKSEKIKLIKNQREAKIENLEISWEQFQYNINSIIAEKSSELGLSSMEDKRLGCWFVKAENGIIKKEIFAQKVLKYLYDDAFKFSRAEVFNKDYKTFEQLSNTFINLKNDSGFDIFTTDVQTKIKNCQNGELNESQNLHDDNSNSNEELL